MMARSDTLSPFRLESTALCTVTNSGDSYVYVPTHRQLPSRFRANQFEAYFMNCGSYVQLTVNRCRRSSAELDFSARMFMKSCSRRGVRYVEKCVAVLSSML